MSLNPRAFKLVLALLIVAPVGVACGGPKKNPVVVAKVKPGDMPEGGAWRGVYFNPLYGHLHMVKDGNAISGKWRTAAGDKWGELHGNAQGDLVRFDWTEHRIGMFGPNAQTTGKGYFRYVVPPGEFVDDELHGEWGLGQSNAGHEWKCVKQRNMQPDLASVTPDEVQTGIEGGDWDREGGSSNAAGNKPAASDANTENEDEWE